ncbi:hypothetical protein [Sporomusa sp. KB1]|jgi:hypothetical protein|uniref:hypothetical protein n=1 Tax=Sporomusa sp. KB1 TaxID=943346 RepID=UPI0011AA8E5E|nr:hypothetical protein [Sporomusa sp. KB1]TWH48561.1 hypothetical protein Salpa_4726 [Sporomusa sp. KB1]
MADKISETIEFLTQIHKAWDGTEQRAALRARPRRSVSYDYISMQPWQSQYLRALTYSQQTQLFQIPLWHAADKINEQIYEAQAVIPISTDCIWQYRGCSHAMVWLDDSYGGTLYTLEQLGSAGVLGLNKQFDREWERGVLTVAPVAWGVLSQADKYLNYTSALSSMTLTVEILHEAQAPAFPGQYDEFHDEEVKLIWGRGLPVIYNGAELFLVPPTWSDDINASFSRLANRLDNSTGAFLYDLRSPDPTETREIQYILKGRREINNLQRFFYRCKGRLHSFYAPTWLMDVELAVDAPAGQNYLLSKWPGYWKYFGGGQRRKTLLVFHKDLSASILNVAGYTTNETGELGKIYLDAPLKQALRKSDILMISYLCRYRLDNDLMTTDYETVGIAKSSLTLAEVTE